MKRGKPDLDGWVSRRPGSLPRRLSSNASYAKQQLTAVGSEESGLPGSFLFRRFLFSTRTPLNFLAALCFFAGFFTAN
jgi:hypothetical protein